MREYFSAPLQSVAAYTVRQVHIYRGKALASRQGKDAFEKYQEGSSAQPYIATSAIAE